MTRPVVTETDLHALVDGQLPLSARTDVEAWLHEHPLDAERVAQYRRHQAALHGAYDEVLEAPVPERLNRIAQRTPRHRLLRYAAVCAWLAIGGVSGWSLHGWWQGAAIKGDAARAVPAFARQAAVAHAVYSPEVRHPVEVGADQEAHLVAWLSKRLATPLRVPHLGAQGFTLVGGRLLPGQPDDRLPVAQFMYQDGKGHRLTLYVRSDAVASRETAFRFAQEKNVGVFYWVDQKLGYALSGEIDKAELLRVANAVYQQLNP